MLQFFKAPAGTLLASVILLFGNLCCSSAPVLQEDVFIRVNQVGYLPDQVKLGVVFARKPVHATEFVLIDAKTREEKFRNTLSENKGSWGNFGFHYYADFTGFRQNGSYILEIGGKKSPVFRLSKAIYANIVDSLLEFLTVQRCGATNPLLHKNCHIYDSPSVVGDDEGAKADVTGGWHDAGDYVKFLNTSAFTTYMLLLAYETNGKNLQSDRNHNGVPDVLEEARIGIDWLLRCNYKGTSLINQVQDSRDHDQSWRLPENDSLKYDRPAFKGIGKNLIGIYSATLALASRIWRDNFHDQEFANKLLNTAQKFYAIRNKVPDIDQTTSGMYVDHAYKAKLALGAIELYKATNRPEYLTDAKLLASTIQPDFWWSWGDINGLAFYRIAPFSPELKDNLEKNLIQFNTTRKQNIFSEGTSYTWGTTHTFLGIALQSMFWKQISGTARYDSLASAQVDYVLGNNPWGVSFIANFGTRTTKHFHSQVAYFNHGYLPGAIAAGPVPKEALKNFVIKREDMTFDEFNSADVKYYDDRMDYLTNEPTIVTNATAIFLFSSDFFQKK